MRSAGTRFLIVGLLALLMFIPLFFVGSVIDSRADYSRDAMQSVGLKWGGPQTLSGPVLVVPVAGPVTRTERRDVTNPTTGQTETETYEVTEDRWKNSLYLLPSQFDVTLSTASTIRRRGIFNVPVYNAEAQIDFAFDIPETRSFLDESERLFWDRAYVQLGLTSNRALRGVARLTKGDTEYALEPLTNSRSGDGVTAVVGDPRKGGSYSMTLGLNGAEKIEVVPVGRTTALTITGDWPHPSFFGAFLPDGSEVREDGFSASWSIPHLARSLPQTAREGLARGDRDRTSFGVRFFQPNDFYQKAYRAARYGILFIALTFLTVLLIENRTGAPAHPVQYILIGIAQSIFVLLMVAYAEQIGFGWAYLLSAGATTLLLTMFGALGLKLGSRTLVLALMLAVLYGVLYLILRSADYALLAGATLAFAALAGTMYATRNEDWYGPPRDPKRKGWFGRAPAQDDAATPPANPE